eukprot:TRINITY_DN14395_c0_g4_i1.p1 TRINITY_DN14395_c0_g4~~TRINITY_DN14395_c0_g4_i1.p1  ORF type:complete len:590 (+),score=80.38 TRINITY_DN14395_c0_g4_i1:79-1848(+)
MAQAPTEPRPLPTLLQSRKVLAHKRALEDAAAPSQVIVEEEPAPSPSSAEDPLPSVQDDHCGLLISPSLAGSEVAPEHSSPAASHFSSRAEDISSSDSDSSEPQYFGHSRSDTSTTIAVNLFEAQVAARRLRWKISGPPLCLGSVTFLVAVVIMVVNLTICSPILFCTSTVSSIVGAGMMLMALLPTDHAAVRAGIYIWCSGSTAVCATYVFISVRIFAVAADMLAYTSIQRGYGVICLLLAAHQVTFMKRFVGGLKQGTRARLSLLWRLFAEFTFVLGCWKVFIAILDIVASRHWPHAEAHLGAVLVDAGMAPTAAAEATWGPLLLISGSMLAFIGASWTLSGNKPQMPKWLYSWLSSLGEEVAAAASIASALGGRDILLVMQKAKLRCRGVPLDRVTKHHMTSNVPMDMRTYENTGIPMKLGAIDAFVSHSWHDDPEVKWNALQSWRQNFVSTHGREPVCWIDKYCIDQTNISEDLMCLPVYLAGSRSLVILHGPTYLSRLWCIMELLVYMLMKGSNRESVVLIDARAGSDVRSEDCIASFAVENAKCVKSEDKDMLFAIVEAGFEDLASFDELVKRLMTTLTASKA